MLHISIIIIIIIVLLLEGELAYLRLDLKLAS